MTRRLYLAILLGALLWGHDAFAVTCFWRGGTAAWDGSNTASWANASGGTASTCAAAGGIPGAADDTVFDGSSGGGTVTVNVAINVNSITDGAYNGTINWNAQTINVGSYSCTGSAVRVRNVTSTTWNVSANSGTVWNCATVTNLTWTNTTTATVNINGNGARTVARGALNYVNTSFVESGSGAISHSNPGSAWTGVNYTRTGTVAVSDSVTIAPMTLTGTCTFTGGDAAHRLLVVAGAVGSPRTMTCGASAGNANVDFQSITCAGAAVPCSGTSIGDVGGNTGFTFTGSKTSYWVGNAGSMSDAANHMAASTGGAPGLANFPLPQDTFLIDANSFTLVAQTLTIDEPRLGAVDFTGVLNNPTVTPTINYTIVGNLTAHFGTMTWGGGTGIVTNIQNQSGTLNIDLGIPHISTIIHNVVGWGPLGSLTINAPGGTVRLASNFMIGGAMTLSAGALDANGYDLQYNIYQSTGTGVRSMFMRGGTWLSTSNANVWTISGSNITIDPGTSTVMFFSISATARTFAGGGFRYWNFLDTGHDGVTTAHNTIFTGANSFNAIQTNVLSAAPTLTFPAGQTTVTNSFAVNGLPGQLVTVNSSSSGSAATIVSKSGQPFTMNYVSVQDFTASGSTPWLACNSTNVSGNSNITFNSAACAGNGLASPVLLGKQSSLTPANDNFPVLLRVAA